MSIRNLEYLFNPRSIALIGASRKERSIGQVVARNLFKGGFQGPVMPVHPSHQSIEGVLAYSGVDQLPIVPDLAIIATPPATIPKLVEELGARGTRAVVVISAGFDDETRQAMLEAARPNLLRVVGPNGLGVLLPRCGVNASFSHVPAQRGDLAFVAQSGAMVTSMLDWAEARGIGFSSVISLGDMSDVDFGDLLDYLAIQPESRAILLYVETIRDARKFMSAARAAARVKPVIVIKGGRSSAGAQAASSHTGALGGSDQVFDAAIRRAGMLRVGTLHELFDAAATLSIRLRPPGPEVAILTNGGGLGVLAADALTESGARLAALSEAGMASLDEVLPKSWSRGNPVDIVGDAPGARYSQALEVLLREPDVDAVLVMNCPTAVADPLDAARALVATGSEHKSRIVTAWLGERAAEPSRALLRQNGFAVYATPEAAVAALGQLLTYARNQRLLAETPPSHPELFERDRDQVAKIIAEALEQGREWLEAEQVSVVLDAYGIPVTPTRHAGDPEEAAAIAEELGFPVALKIRSADIVHKSDVGGVMLELASHEAVRDAASGMLKRVERFKPEAKVDGFVVQTMVPRGDAHELILGIGQDRLFGPFVLFGHGGTAVEVLQDRSVALPPLNLALARRMMRETRVYRLLEGYRDRQPAAIDDIALALVKLSQLAADHAEIQEVDINPLLARPDGVIGVDARVRIARSEAQAEERLAIRPYPSDLEQEHVLPGGEKVALRPIRPEDEPALQEAFRKLTPEDVRMRFFAQLSELSHSTASRLTQIDYHREMALIAYDPEVGDHDIMGVVRIHSDPDGLAAEFAVIVRSDIQHRGLGRLLMGRIIAYCRERHTREIWGTVLRENRGMLGLAKELGFEQRPDPKDPNVVRITLAL